MKQWDLKWCPYGMEASLLHRSAGPGLTVCVLCSPRSEHANRLPVASLPPSIPKQPHSACLPSLCSPLRPLLCSKSAEPPQGLQEKRACQCWAHRASHVALSGSLCSLLSYLSPATPDLLCPLPPSSVLPSPCPSLPGKCLLLLKASFRAQ